MLPNREGDDFRFRKTLHNDIKLLPNEWKRKWDMQFENGDVVNVSGLESLKNAVCIAIMTSYKELSNELYAEFGCRIHELLKRNMGNLVRRKMEYYTEDVLVKMRRISKVNEILIEEMNFGYLIYFNITSINDEIVRGEVVV